MDIGTIIGFISGAIFLILSMLLGANWDMDKIAKGFIDGPSVLITIGGTIASTLISIPLPRVLTAMKATGKIFFPIKLDPTEAITKIIALSNLARKEGVLALEGEAMEMEDPFLQKGIMLIVDGAEPELVRNILETEMAYIEGRHGDIRGVWETIGTMGPAWGMIGTLLGLILMLQDMSDPSLLGPSMAVAIVTTFYGSIIANFIANPIANKLKIYSSGEMLLKEVLIEGMLSIQAGENPRIIEEKLKAFLSPALRRAAGEDKSKPEAGDE